MCKHILGITGNILQIKNVNVYQGKKHGSVVVGIMFIPLIPQNISDMGIKLRNFTVHEGLQNMVMLLLMLLLLVRVMVLLKHVVICVSLVVS